MAMTSVRPSTTKPPPGSCFDSIDAAGALFQAARKLSPGSRFSFSSEPPNWKNASIDASSTLTCAMLPRGDGNADCAIVSGSWLYVPCFALALRVPSC
jgi:hypothetical protein